MVSCPCHLFLCAGLVCLLLGIVLGALGRLLDHPVYGPFVQSLHTSLVAFIHRQRFGLLATSNLGDSLQISFVQLAKSSEAVNGILQCGLGGQKLYNGEKKTF